MYNNITKSFFILITILPIIGHTQNERWVYIYSGVPEWQDDCATGLCHGLDGNLYTGGYTWNTGTNEDFTVISLTDSGSERWLYRYSSPGNNGDECHSICYGIDGNIYAAGACAGSDTSLHHFTVISLTAGGAERWVYQYSQSSSANSVCFGSDGNIYAVGYTQGKILVVSLDVNGNERWTYVYDTPSSESNPGKSITYGLDGNVYVTGYTGPTWNTDVTVISLTPSGSERWVYLYNGPGGIYDYGRCVVYGQDENLYVFGSTCYLVGSYFVYSQGLAISLTTSGSERWTYISPADPSGFDCGIFSADGNLYAAGAYGWDFPFFFVESISDSGTYRWQYIDTLWGYANAIVSGDSGNIYTAGIVYDTCDNFVVVCFGDTGSIIWKYHRHDGESTAITFSTDGNIYAAGRTWDNVTGSDFTVVSLSSTGIQEENSAKDPIRKGLKLEALPNIISDNVLLQYTIHEKQHISLALYDFLGRKIVSIIEGVFEPAIHSYIFDTSDLSQGVYFLIFEGETEIKTEKILVVR